MTEWILLASALVLVAACGGFVAAEFALVTVDRAAVERAAERGARGAAGTLAALRTLSTQLSGAQLGITITNLAIGFLATPAIGVLIEGPLASLGLGEGAVIGVSATVALVLATFFTMVFGELVPKNLAIANPMGVARATNTFQRGFTRAMARPIGLFNGSANAIVRFVGVEPQEELRSARNPQEIGSLVRRSAAQGVLDTDTARLVERSLAFGSRTAADILTPRVRMHAVDASDPVSAVVELARRTGHSRFPVVDGSADTVVGAVHIKHAVGVPLAQRAGTPVSAVAVAPTTAPESLELDPLLLLLRREGMQMAIVVDEYGGTAGIVTLEDLVEELVGDIADEHDRPGAHARVTRDGGWSLSGLLRPDEVESITGVPLPEGHAYETIAGLVLERSGEVPSVGDRFEIGLPGQLSLEDDDSAEPVDRLVVLTVERLEGLRIARVHLRLVDLSAAPPDPAADGGRGR